MQEVPNDASKADKIIHKILAKEEERLRSVLKADQNDFEELQSDWQERDSPAERNTREVEWNQFSALQNELSEIAAARQRLEDGVYGICEDCSEEIAPKRLRLLPATRKCIECQSKTESELGIDSRSATL